DTLVRGQPWFNRQALIGGPDKHGDIDQGTGIPEEINGIATFYNPGAYNRFFEDPFIYDDLRERGFRSIVINQQAGLGQGNSPAVDNGDDIWERFSAKTLNELRKAAEFHLPRILPKFNQSAVSSALDVDALNRAIRQIARTRGEFDLMVIYLAGLDHFVHDEGASEGQGEKFFRESVSPSFRQSLHEHINEIVRALEGNVDDSTAYGVFADHGHYDTDPEKFMNLDERGQAISSAGIPTWRRVLQASDKLRVSNKFFNQGLEFVQRIEAKIESVLGSRPTIADFLGSLRKDVNVIFNPLYSIANVYVAGDITSPSNYDWTRPPSVQDLEAIVDNIFDWYMSGKFAPLRPVSDMLVRVPLETDPDSFDQSFYMAVPRDYDPNRSDCGASGTERCGLTGQLVTLEDYFSMHTGIGDDAVFPWTFNKPVERITDWISTNTGDIVLFANAQEGFQFYHKGLRGQHGSLTLADSLVPVTFGYPGSTSGDTDKDNTLQAISQFFEILPSEGTGDPRDPEPAIQAIVEADALRVFFGIPFTIREHGEPTSPPERDD
ncbi:MAG: alkaline phosphatase family protein, partial [Bacteroidota bacterium]